MMASKAHAVLSASASHRWLHCPPSARLCETYEDKGSDYAAEGTDAHELCEYKLRKALNMKASDPTKNLTWYNEEMDDCANGKKRSYSCNHCFSQIIICGDCGEMFRRIHWNNRGCKSIVWRCISKLEPTGLECHARTINELDLQEIVLTALNELLGDKSKYQKQLQQNIASVIRASAAITTDGIDEKLMELQQELVKKANNKEAYDEIADQVFALREKRQQASMDTVQRDEQLQRITELQDFIKDQSSDLTVFDEALVKRWLKQITIWDDHCTVELKSGLKVDVER